MRATLLKGDIQKADMLINLLNTQQRYVEPRQVVEFIPADIQRERIIRVLSDYDILTVNTNNCLSRATELSTCIINGGAIAIYKEQQEQAEKNKLELRQLRRASYEARFAIALAIVSICAAEFWGKTIFEWIVFGCRWIFDSFA